MNNSMLASSFASTSVHGQHLFSRGDTQSINNLGVPISQHHPHNLLLSPSSLNGNLSELRQIFGGANGPIANNGSIGTNNTHVLNGSNTKEEQLYSTDEDGIMRFNSVVGNQNPTDEEQIFLRSENNAS